VIVIDGGSTDGSLDLIRKYSDRISYWESGKDSGIADAFNRGIKKASGDIVAILNSDDYWACDTVKNVVQVATQNPQFDVYYGDLRFHNINSGEQYILKATLKGIQRRMTVFHPSIFIRKKAYEKIGLYDVAYSYAMDSEWIHRAIKSKLTFYNVPFVVANMSLGGVSDKYYLKSLAEYRKSLITHGIQTPTTAWMYFLFFSLGKTIMKIDSIRDFYRNRTNREKT